MKNLNLSTDLALEWADTGDKKLPSGVIVREERAGNFKKTTVIIKNSEEAERLKRKKGKYVTFEGSIIFKEELVSLLEEELRTFIPKGDVLVAGFGNIMITPDSIGPLAAQKITATAHLGENFKKSFQMENLRNVYVAFLGSAGQTGMETCDHVKALCERYNFSSVVAIDALASYSSSKLGNTFQISSSGISPGSGVGNKRKECSFETLGIPCISVGVPTVTNAFSLEGEGKREDMFMTTKDIDIITEKCSAVIGESINLALHPKEERERIKLFMQ